MTDAGMNEESAIPREAAWPQEVVELVKAARRILFGHSHVASESRFHSKESEIDARIEDALRRALAPFKEIAND